MPMKPPANENTASAIRSEHREKVVQRFKRLLRDGKHLVIRSELRTVVVPNANETASKREHRECDQRQRHHQRRFVRVRGSFGFFLAAEYDEEQTERVKRRQRGHKNSDSEKQITFLRQRLR